MASPLADFVVALHDGHIVSQGSIADAVSKDKAVAKEYEQDKEAIELDVSKNVEANGMSNHDAPAKTKDGKLVVAEEIAEGHVTWKACESFSTAAPLERCLTGFGPFSRALPRCTGRRMALVLLAAFHICACVRRNIPRVEHVVARLLGATVYLARRPK